MAAIATVAKTKNPRNITGITRWMHTCFYIHLTNRTFPVSVVKSDTGSLSIK